jgi:predicted transcriptional regulator
LPENEIVYTNDEGKQLRKWKLISFNTIYHVQY